MTLSQEILLIGTSTEMSTLGIDDSQKTRVSKEHSNSHRRKKVSFSPTLTNGSTLHQDTQNSTIRQKRESRPIESRSRPSVHFALRHTWSIPLILISIILCLYAVNPTKSNIFHCFIFLSYQQDEAGGSSNLYGKGLWDLAFVLFHMIVLSFTREFIMQEILRPIARYSGITSRGKQVRFMEQAYTTIYFAVMGPFGIYVMRQTPVWYFNTRGMYENYPHKTQNASLKFYYLFQAAYWAQQAIVMVLGLEKRRKDFKEYVAHHVVTLLLIGLSYRFHFTYIGIAVYLTHDISDFFLSSSKSLHYIGSPITEAYFAMSIGAWIYLRHYLNLRILFSLFTEFKTIGPYELDWKAGQFKCALSNVIAISLLAGLQAINIFWLFCLLRAIYRILVHRVSKDDRSDDEESGQETQD